MAGFKIVKASSATLIEFIIECIIVTKTIWSFTMRFPSVQNLTASRTVNYILKAIEIKIWIFITEKRSFYTTQPRGVSITLHVPHIFHSIKC